MQQELIQFYRFSAFTHGMLYDPLHPQPLPFALYPVQIPNSALQSLLEVQPLWDTLVESIASDLATLQQVLSKTRLVDPLVDALLTMAGESCASKAKGGAFIRNDFMFHKASGLFKQIQINTFSIAFIGASRAIVDMHSMNSKHVLASRARPSLQIDQPLLLVITSSSEKNIFDIHKDGVESIVTNFEQAVAHSTFLESKAFFKQRLVGGVYYRIGYVWEHYNHESLQLRRRWERSDVVSIPSARYQLAGMKRLQAQFLKDSFMGKYLKKEQIRVLRRHIVDVFDFDEGVPPLQQNKRYLLKSQREGGGSVNSHQQSMKSLKTLQLKELQAFVLMEQIDSPVHTNVLVRGQTITKGLCKAEIGIFSGVGRAGCSRAYLTRVKLQETKQGGVMAGASCISSLAEKM